MGEILFGVLDCRVVVVTIPSNMAVDGKYLKECMRECKKKFGVSFDKVLPNVNIQ